MSDELKIFGLLAEFASPEALIDAARQAQSAGYRNVEAYSPFPVPELFDALALPPSRIPTFVLIGGILGALAGFAMQWYANVISYPWNVGGKPPNSWPAYVPITFELGVLCAALSALIGMIASCRLPAPFHPLFNAEHFDRASSEKFFLCIEASDRHFSIDGVRDFLTRLAPLSVVEVPK